MTTSVSRVILLFSVAATLSCGSNPRVSSSSRMYDGQPPPSFVLRKFSPEEERDVTHDTDEPEIDSVEPCASPETCTHSFKLNQLAVKTLGLSNQAVDSTMNSLAAMGYKTIVSNYSSGTANPAVFDQEKFALNETYDCFDLPVVMLSHEFDDGEFSFPPGSVEQAGLSQIRRSHSGDVDRLIVFYRREQPETLATLEFLIRDVIDVAAAQVYIEGWVLEILSEDSTELGIRYTNTDKDGLLILGSDSVDSANNVLDYFKDTSDPSLTPGISWKIRALVENGKAEILSRPSLLAMSNRQAIIQIVDVVEYPIQDIFETSQGTRSTANSFDSIDIGITLNLRPRVSADRQWVSMEIDAVVETEDEENTGEAIVVEDGESFVVATKPGTSKKRVHTFVRIPDRTPIIVGGLVTKEKATLKSRIPGVGSIPGVGALFGATDWDVKQREIMIILTPYILAEDAIGVASNTPKESSYFDETDMVLFEDRYRLRAEDLFDLSNLTRTSRFMNYLYLIEQEAKIQPRQSLAPHYAAFLDGNFPGGEALVARTFFDLVEKLDLARKMNLGAVRLGMRQKDELQHVSLREALKAADGEPLVLVTSDSGALTVYAELSGELEGVVIANDADVDRLVKSIVAREMIRINGGHEAIKIRNLRVGQYVELPSIEGPEEFSIDLETLRTFENSQNYENVVYASMEEAFRRIDEDIE